MGQQVLLQAKKNHIKNNPDHDVFCGMNFIECVSCKKHAHIISWPPVNVYLLLHDKKYRFTERIETNEF